MRSAYDATVPIGRQAKYLAALRAQFAAIKGAKVTATPILVPLARPRAGKVYATPRQARIIVMVPE